MPLASPKLRASTESVARLQSMVHLVVLCSRSGQSKAPCQWCDHYTIGQTYALVEVLAEQIQLEDQCYFMSREDAIAMFHDLRQADTWLGSSYFQGCNFQLRNTKSALWSSLQEKLLWKRTCAYANCKKNSKLLVWRIVTLPIDQVWDGKFSVPTDMCFAHHFPQWVRMTVPYFLSPGLSLFSWMRSSNFFQNKSYAQIRRSQSQWLPSR